MRALRCFRYNFVQGVKGVFRNSVMSFASILVLVSCMIILGTFYLVLDNIQENFNRIQSLNEIEARMPVTSSDAQIEEIGEKINEICRDMDIIESDATYISREEHLKLFHELYADQAWSHMFDEKLNPLRPSYKLKFSNFSDISEVAQIVTRIEQITLEDGTVPFTNADIASCIDLYRNVATVKKILLTVGLWLLGILLLITLFVIMNTIKLGVFARRNEVMFMRYCGATKAFIRTPFLVEGALLGLLSAGISLGLEYFLYHYALRGLVSSATAAISEGITLSPFIGYLPILAVLFCALGLFAGLISSSISLKKYLNV